MIFRKVFTEEYEKPMLDQLEQNVQKVICTDKLLSPFHSFALPRVEIGMITAHVDPPKGKWFQKLEKELAELRSPIELIGHI